MKITVFGLTLSSSWGNGHATPYRAIIRALDRLGHRVHFFEKDVSYYRSRRDFDSCDYCELTLYSEWADVRDLALSTAADSDVVITASFLPEGRRINDELLDLGRPLHIFYDLDTPVTLSGLRQGEVEYLDPSQIPEFDLVLSFTGEGRWRRWKMNIAHGWYELSMAASIPTTTIALPQSRRSNAILVTWEHTPPTVRPGSMPCCWSLRAAILKNCFCLPVPCIPGTGSGRKMCAG